MQYERTHPLKEKIYRWFEDFRTDLQDHRKLIASDAMYGITVNPFLFFLFAFPKNTFLATPLRDIFSDPVRIVEMLETIANNFGQSITKNTLFELSAGYLKHLLENSRNAAPLKMIEWLLHRVYLSSDRPATVSTFLECVNPLNPALRNHL